MTTLQHLIDPLTDMQVANIAGCKNTRPVTNWRNGTTPTLKFMLNFEKHFNKSSTQLLSPHVERKAKR